MQRKNRAAGLAKIKAQRKLRVALVVSDFNSDITHELEKGARIALNDAGVDDGAIMSFHVAGSYEIPLACQKLARLGNSNPNETAKFDGIIAIGCVIKGKTDHYRFIAGESSRGVMDVMLKENIPIANAILTVHNLSQAKARCGKESNKGAEAAEALLGFLNVFAE